MIASRILSSGIALWVEDYGPHRYGALCVDCRIPGSTYRYGVQYVAVDRTPGVTEARAEALLKGLTARQVGALVRERVKTMATFAALPRDKRDAFGWPRPPDWPVV